MRIRKREIAKTGIYGTSENPQIISANDIKEIEETFSDVRRAPIWLGHSAAAAAPRLGNVVSVYSDNDFNILYAGIEEHDALALAVDSGYYPDVSVGAKRRAKDGKMYLHHLAYLGQEPPAIKDLIGEIKEPLGIAAADTDIEGLVLFPSCGNSQMYLSDSTKTNKDGFTVDNEEAQRLREENERLKGELEKREMALSDSIKRQTEADIGLLKGAMNTAKIPAPQQERFLQIASALEPGKTIELSDGAGGAEKMSGIDALIRVVSCIPPPVQTGALNLSDIDGQSQSKRGYSRLLNKG